MTPGTLSICYFISPADYDIAFSLYEKNKSWWFISYTEYSCPITVVGTGFDCEELYE